MNGWHRTTLLKSSKEVRVLLKRFNCTDHAVNNLESKGAGIHDFLSDVLNKPKFGGKRDISRLIASTAEELEKFGIRTVSDLSSQSTEQWKQFKIEYSVKKSLFHSVHSNGDVYQIIEKHNWKEPQNHRKYFDWLGEQLNITTSEDWYRVSLPEAAKRGGYGLISRFYGDSLAKAIMSVYPEYHWLPWRFDRIPEKFWHDPANHRMYLDWVEERLGITDKSQWYKVTYTQLKKLNALRLLEKHEHSIAKTLTAVYPEYNWVFWEFAKMPQRWWQSTRNQKLWMDWVADEKLHLESMEDWYKVTVRDLSALGGSPLMRYYDDSLFKLLQNIYPEYPWQPFRFRNIPVGWWKVPSNARQCLDWLGTKLGIEKLDDWYSVTYYQLDAFGMAYAMKIYGGFYKMLCACYPEHKWVEARIKKTKTQALLFKMMKSSFPDIPIQLNYRHTEITSDESMKKLELDVYCPSISLALEYHGIQHYQSNYTMGSPGVIQELDAQKREACKVLGITLVEIPYWWDKTQESLLATIRVHRPDLVGNEVKGVPIPATRQPKPRNSKKKLR